MTLCIALVFLGVASGLNVSVFDDCVVSKLYGNIVNADDLHVYVVREAWGYLRVTTESLSETDQDCPIMFSVERNGMFDTWTLPTEQGHQKLSRTLCPRDILNGDQFRIHVSTIGSMTSRPIQYSLVVDNVQIELNSSMGQLFGVLTPFRPLVFKVDKSNMSREALVMVTSPDQTCCHLSVQSYDCPIYEIDRFGQSKASFQTMTTLGALMLPEKVSTVYVVLTMTCGDDPSVNMSSSLHKQISVNISIVNQMTSFDVGLALIAPIVLFSLVSLGTLCYFTSHGSLADDFTHDDPLDQVIQPQDNEESLLLSLESITSADCSRPRSTADELIERRVFPRRFMSVADLSLQDEKYLHKKFNVYAQLTVTVGLFYVIPVIQLVLQYQSAFLITGNEDLCYFNFLCTRKYMSITAFNNVFSNIGYCALGLLYLAVVTLRERNHELLDNLGCPGMTGLPVE